MFTAPCSVDGLREPFDRGGDERRVRAGRVRGGPVLAGKWRGDSGEDERGEN